MASPSKNKRLFDGKEAFGRVLKKATPQLKGEITIETGTKTPSIRVTSYQALVRVAGYFKYNTEGTVLYRGQTNCFGTMRSSLHRRPNPPSNGVIAGFLNRYRKAMSADPDPRYKLTTEPLLQHYGLDTRWLDVVDSLPHALFFATHKLCPGQFSDTITYCPSIEDHGFVYLLDVGPLTYRKHARKDLVGYSHSKGLEIVDLRSLKPSNALRPHAQHGLLVRAFPPETEMWPLLVARIVVPTREARQWIAAGSLEREALFPTRVWDSVYDMLLSDRMKDFLDRESQDWGEILRFDFALSSKEREEERQKETRQREERQERQEAATRWLTRSPRSSAGG